MKKIIALAILIVAVVLFEAAALSNWYLLPTTPDIMLIVILYIGMKNGSNIGQLTGFFSGLLIDFLSASPFGLNSLVRTILGFLSGLLHLNVSSKGIIMPATLGFVATLTKATVIFIVSFFYPGKIVLYSLFSSNLWYECLFNALLSPLIFFALSMFTVLSADFNRSLMNE